jgi:hypothetical protein
MTMTLGAIGGKRDVFLQRIAAMLALRGRGRFTDTDVAEVAQSGTPIGTEIPQPIKGLNCEYRYPFPGFARSVQRVQILGGPVGDFFGTQIGASQPAHSHRTDGTLGVAMSATR